MGLIILGKNFLHWTFSVIIAGHLTNTKNRIWRTFWSILLIATLAAFCFHSATGIIEYLSYEKTTVVQLLSTSAAPFPAVTICNLNPFKNSTIDNSQTLSNLISAYKYTLEKKEDSSISSAETSVEHSRKKRAPPSPPFPAPSSSACDKTQQASVKAPSQPSKQNYIIEGFFCNPSYYNLTYYLCGKTDLTITLPNVSTINYNLYKTDIDKGVYLCFHDSFCDNFCDSWDTGLDALTNLTECAKSNFNYPPETDGFNFMALIAESYSSYCELSDKGCKLGLYKKKSTIYPGNYWYKDCYFGQPFGYNANLITMTMEACENTTTYELDTYLLSTCTGYVKNISDTFSNVLDETDCGTTCGKTCPLTGTNLCFYNQNDLCTFYKKCTTTGTTTIPLSTTTHTLVTSTTTKPSTTLSSTLTSKSSTVKSSTSSTVSSTTKSSVVTNTAVTTTFASTSAFSTTTIPDLKSTTNELSEAPTFSSFTETQNTESTTTDLMSSTSTTPKYETPVQEDSTEFFLISSTSDAPPKSASTSTVKTSPQSSTDSSTRVTTTKKFTSSQDSDTHSSTISSSSLSSKASTKAITLPTFKWDTLSTTKWPNLPTIKPWTISNAQISTSKSSTLSSSSKTAAISTTTKKLSSSPTNATSLVYTTSPLVFRTDSLEKTTKSNINNPTVTKSNDHSAETTILPKTTKTNPKSTTKSETNTKTDTVKQIPFETTTPLTSMERTTKIDNSVNSETTTSANEETDSETKTGEVITSIPIDNSENSESTVVNDITDRITSNTTTFAATTTTKINTNQMISRTSEISTSPASATVQPSSKTTDNFVKNTSSTPSPIFTTAKGSSIKVTLPSTTNKQNPSSTVTVINPIVSKTSKTSKTTTVKPKTTTNSSSYDIQLSTKENTIKETSFNTFSSSEKMTTQLPTQASNDPEMNTPGASLPSSTELTFSQSAKTIFPNETLTTTLQPSTIFAVTSTPSDSVTSKITTSTKSAQQTHITTPSTFATTTNSINELESLSQSYKFNPNQSYITIQTNAQQSLVSIAASLTEEEKNAMGYKIGDLIQTCIIDGVPCNIERDFTQIYDVDYGFCYTFNADSLYNTTRMGSEHGLKMVVLSDINEYIATSAEQGIKVVVHPQEELPFPNVDGYRSATGKEIDLRVTYGIVSRLDAPYGTCNSLDKLKKLNQPFYFNGTYTVEGCYRSCFQQKISIACNCSDPRFPLPTDLSTNFCQISDTKKYACYEKYIQDNGDYFHVEGCSCEVTCDETTFTAAVYYSNWPYGTFFYQALCTNSTLMNGTDQINCQKYYRKNGVLVLVSYARLGYETLEEVPVNSAFDLFNNLAGNTGLWIGFSAITAAEFILIFVQLFLWIFTPWELMEVPSFRRRNYPEPENDSENGTDETGSTDATIGAGSAFGSFAAFNSFYPSLLSSEMDKSRHLIQPKYFPNDLRRRHPGTMVADPSSIFEPIKPVSHVDVYDSQLISPTPVQTAVNESIPEL